MDINAIFEKFDKLAQALDEATPLQQVTAAAAATEDIHNSFDRKAKSELSRKCFLKEVTA